MYEDVSCNNAPLYFSLHVYFVVLLLYHRAELKDTDGKKTDGKSSMLEEHPDKASTGGYASQAANVKTE